jgi:hypothetical protein
MRRTSPEPDCASETDNPPHPVPKHNQESTSSDEDYDKNPHNNNDCCEGMKDRCRHCGLRSKPLFYGSHTSGWCWLPDLQRKCSVCRSLKHTVRHCPLRKMGADDYCQVCGIVFRKGKVGNIKACSQDECTSTYRLMWTQDTDGEDSDFHSDREEDNEAGAPVKMISDLNLKK